MDAARRAAAALAVLAGLVGPARAQDGAAAQAPSHPIPYTQLVRGAAPRRAAKPRAKPKPHSVAAQATAATAVAAGPPPGSAAIPASATPPPSTAAPPPAPAVAPRILPVVAVPAAPAPPPPAPIAPPAGARLPPGGPLPPAEVEAFVDAMISRDLARGHVVGAAVAVVQSGQIVLEKGYGVADRSTGRRVDPQRTGVRLGSASRLLTDLLVLKLAEAGRLDLAASVDATLPPALKLPPEGFARSPRLGEVLQQRDGFETRAFGHAFLPAGDVPTLDEGLRRLRSRRVRDPGGPPIASDYGAALAGAAAAHAQRIEFESLAENELLAPSGLTSTSFREPRRAHAGLPAPLSAVLAARLAQGYGWGPHGLTPLPYGFAGGLAPALSATTTADDMARLMLLELAGGRTTTGAAVWGERTQARLHAGAPAGEPLSGAAYGRMRTRLPGGFAGFGAAGAAPGFRVRYLVAPQLGLGVFVAENSDTAEAADVLAPLLVQRFYAGPSEAAGGAAPAGSGLYLDARRAYHGLEGFVDRLERLVRVDSAAGGGLVTRGLGRNESWSRPVGGGALVSASGEQLTLLGPPGGRAEAIAEPGRAALAERVGWLHWPVTLAISATLAAAAALLVLGGLFARLGREGARPTGQQTAAMATQVVAAVLWLSALTAFALFRRGEAAGVGLLRRWPDPWLVGASVLAFTAALLTLVQILQLPGAWAEGRRLSGWAAGRKLRHTLTVVVFAAFAAVLASWGALEPWSS